MCFEQWNQRHDVSKGFIRSGGEAIDDKDWRSKSQRDYFLNYYENYFTQENSFLQTCKNILLIQNLCDKHNIKYCMFVYNNIFNWTKNDHTYRDFLTKTKGVEKMVDVFNTSRHIYNLIDFDKFIFYESDTTEMGGLAEFAHENDVEYWDDYDNDGDDFHVSYTGHQKFINHFENDIETEKSWSFHENVYDTFKDASAIIVLTEWEEYKNIDWLKVIEKMIKPTWVFDTRSILNKQKIKDLGLNYWGIGCS